MLRTALGLEHYGGAYKDPGSEAIILPGADGRRAGIGCPLRADTVGMRFTLAGSGSREQPGELWLALGVADAVAGTGKFLKMALPPAGAPPMQVEVRWTAGKYTVSIRQDGMEPYFTENDRAPDAKHLIIAASGPAACSTARSGCSNASRASASSSSWLKLRKP